MVNIPCILFFSPSVKTYGFATSLVRGRLTRSAQAIHFIVGAGVPDRPFRITFRIISNPHWTSGGFVIIIGISFST